MNAALLISLLEDRDALKRTTEPTQPPTFSVERTAEQRSIRPRRFAKFDPEWIPFLPNPTAQTVFLVLLSHARSDGECWPRRTTIASMAHISLCHVSEALRALEGIGAVKTIHTKGKRSRYKVMFHPQESVVPDSGITPNGVVPDLDTTVVPDSGSSQVSESGTTRNRPGNISMNITSRVRARDDGEEKTTDEEAGEASDFILWFLKSGVDAGVLRQSLDIHAAAQGESLPHAEKLIGTWGRAECEARTLRFFTAVDSAKLRRAPTIEGFAGAWDCSALKPRQYKSRTEPGWLASAMDDVRKRKQAQLREPTDGEARVLEICYQWQCGVSIPMPLDLKPLLDTMRLTIELPRRPRT
jgi:hypothetical protein